MGKGDKKTARGKIIMGSYGVTRKKNKKNAKIRVTEKPQEIKKPTISVEKEKVVVEPIVKVVDTPIEVKKPVNIEIEKAEKPKKETVKKEKIKETPVAEEKKATKKTVSKNKEE